MIKKYSKMFIIALVGLCLSVINVSAKTYTNPEGSISSDFIADVTERFSELHNGERFSYMYIIGDHVITSSHIMTTEEFMEASDSIDSKNTGRPYAFYFINNTSTTADGAEWKVEGTSLPSTMTVKYVDFEGEIYDETFDADKYMSNLETTLNKEENTFYTVDYDDASGVLKVVLSDNVQDVKGTGIFTSIVEILKDNACASITLTYKGADGTSKDVVITAEDIEDNSKFNEVIEGLLGNTLSGNNLNGLHGKSFDITFQVTNEDVTRYVGKDKYTVEFYSQMDVNKYLQQSQGESSGKSYKYTCQSVEGKNCTPIINILKGTTSFGGFDMLQNNLKAALKDSRITNIHLEIGTAKVDYKNDTDVDLVNLIKTALGSGSTYNDVAKLGPISVVFTLDDYVLPINDGDSKTVSYTVSIGTYVDVDSIVDAVAGVNNGPHQDATYKDINKYYHLTRKENKLTFDANLKKNGLYNFADVVKGLALIVFGDQSYSVVKNTDDISKLVIIDNTNNKEYPLDMSTPNDDNVFAKSFADSLAKCLGVTSITNANITASKLKNLDISIRFELASGKELIPGLVGGNYTKGSQSATYDLSFKMNNYSFDYMINTNFANANYFDLTAKHTNDVYDLNINLKNVSTPLEEAKLFGKFEPYTGLFKAITLIIGEEEHSLNLSNLEEVKNTFVEVLGLTDSSLLEDLYDKKFTLKFSLADDVNLLTYPDFAPNEKRDAGEYTVNVTLTYDKKVVANKGSIQEALDSNPDVLELAPGETYSGAIKLDSDNDGLIINGNGARVLSDITVEANDVEFNDVDITGKVTIEGDKNVSFIGDGETELNGAIKAEGNGDIVIDGLDIKGTDAAIDFKDPKIASVIDARGTGSFTLKNSKVRYTGDKTLPDDGKGDGSKFVYSLLYIDGDATITDNEFDITGIKNPIEYKVGSNIANSITISSNNFTGENYNEKVAHNVISFYGSNDNSVITVSDNTFEYADWTIRISNPNKTVATYIITGNHIKSTKTSGGIRDVCSALIGLDEGNQGADQFKNVTIVYDENTADGYFAYDIEGHFTSSEEEIPDSSAFIWASEEVNTEENLPKFKTYEQYLSEQKPAE